MVEGNKKILDTIEAKKSKEGIFTRF